MEDISDSIRKIKVFTRNMTFEEFTADEKTRDVVLRNLEVIGEAVKNLLDEIVWDIIQNKIPKLEDKIDGLMEKG
ncbi:MAG: DUF86 domain-containing protein [Candidatus Natronoplasma sp.]